MRKEELEQLREEKVDYLRNEETAKNFINDYDLEDNTYICDAIAYFSDSNVDIYYYSLKEWLKEDDEAIEYFEQVINEGLVDTRNFDFYKCIQAAQYEKTSCNLYEDLETIIEIMIIDYLLDNEEMIDKIEDFEDFIDNIEKNHNNRFEDIKYFIIKHFEELE